MTGSIRIFEKSNFTPKLSVLVFLKVKLPNMTDWHISSYSYSKMSNYTGVNSDFYDIQVDTKSVLYSPFTYNSLWGTKPPLPKSSRDNAVISPNL